MVTRQEHWFVYWMVKLGIWHTGEMITLVTVHARYGTGFILNWIKRRQVVDDLHHAPGCPANHYHKQRLVFSPCTCGAARQAASSDYQPGEKTDADS